MPVRAVVIPGTPLLVPGAAGQADPVAATRRLVGRTLDLLLADAPSGPFAVLAPVPRGAGARVARLRPSLAGVGIDDRWVPGLATWPVPDAPRAHAPASVALVLLAAALEAHGRGAEAADVVTVEVPDGHAPPARALAALRDAQLVVAGGAPGAARVRDDPVADLAPGVAGTFAALDGAAGWSWETTTSEEQHEHLPQAYAVAVCRAG